MDDITAEIVKWLNQRPAWQQQAVEMHLEKGQLSDGDIELIANRLKGTIEANYTTPPNFEGLQKGGQTSDTLRLVNIGGIQDIESLGPFRPLDFGEGNLTVIYGHNGSGKSGYTRILRKVCGHPRAEQLRPNVFINTDRSGQCSVTYQIGTEIYNPIWQASGDPINDLRTVDIFDSEEAQFYISSETGVTYTPPQIALFEQLSSTCGRVRALLELEKKALVTALPELPPEYANTPTAKSYLSLSNLSGDSLDALKNWTQSEQDTLDQLTERLKTVDPASTARQQRQMKVQVDQLVASMRSASRALGQEGIQRIRDLKTEAFTKRKIATEASKVQSGQLHGIGSETWRALWEAARGYSVNEAYPGREFPAASEGDRCVLCHQELDAESRDRLRDFESSIKGSLELSAISAESKYRSALEALPKCMSSVEISTVCTAARLDDSWLQALNQFWSAAQQACERLKNGEPQDKAMVVGIPVENLKALHSYSESLEASALQYDEDASQFDRNQAIASKLNLEAKRWTSQQSISIDVEIRRRKKVDEYDSWISSTNPMSVSVKAGELAQIAITEAYVSRFNAELKSLGADHIRVALIKTRTNRGVAMHRLQLADVKTPGVMPVDVLSEGERRIISLAAFLADVGSKPHAAPFIFDDPISSLDQDYEWAVALRLAQLARDRQVLIFTHRLSLYGAVEDAAKKLGQQWKKQHLVQRYIRSYQGVTGHPTEEGIASVNTKKANNILLDRLKQAVAEGQREGPGAYERNARVICTEFRMLLERTVEDDLLNEVVKRHRRSIQTDGRLGGLPRIKLEDCQYIDSLMTKYSAFEHSQSPETPVRIPDAAELEGDIQNLVSWRTEFNGRSIEPMA